jgi:hypothetical protein
LKEDNRLQGGLAMNGLRFRKHPELAPSGKVTIAGPARCRAERMNAYAARRNPAAPPVAEIYLEKAAAYGIRGDVAYCQAMYDTKVWTVLSPSSHWQPVVNRIWGTSDAVWSDGEWEERIETHLEQLFVFMSAEERREACWEDLNGKWMIPGSRYGQDIVAIWRNMIEWKGEEGMKEDMQDDARPWGLVPEEEWNAEAGQEDLNWLAGRGWLPVPEPHPDRRVTWSELARLFRQWERSAK